MVNYLFLSEGLCCFNFLLKKILLALPGTLTEQKVIINAKYLKVQILHENTPTLSCLHIITIDTIKYKPRHRYKKKMYFYPCRIHNLEENLC